MTNSAAHELPDDGLPDDGYSGPATIERDDVCVPAQVTLRGQVDTIGGHYHWYGRVAADPAVAALVSGGPVLLRTPHGAATTRLSDVDPWGRYRVEGRGAAPFTVLCEVPTDT